MSEKQDLRVGHDDAPTVVFVCTANLCRSSMAELLLRERLRARRQSWHVRSVGTRAVDGRPMHPNAVRVLTERGIADPDWRSHALTLAEVERADLILTAEQEHRAAVDHIAPAALRLTWTLLHFAYLVDLPTTECDDRAESVELLLSRARDGQSQAQPLAPGEMDLADPVAGSVRQFRRCADTIENALERIFG